MKRFKTIHLLKFFIFVGVLVGFFSCEVSQPEIVQVFTQINNVWNPQKRSWTERLAVYAQVSNEDGIEELERMHIHHNQSRLWWRLQKDSWNLENNNGETWIGSSSLQVPNGEDLPTGSWQVQLVSRSGNQAKTEFTLLPESGLEKRNLPKNIFLNKKPDLIELKNFPSSSFLLWLYDEKGDFIASKEQVGKQFPLSSFMSNPRLGETSFFVLYSYFPQEGRGLIAGPYPLRD